MHDKPETRSLPVTLTPEERIERGARLGETQFKLDMLDGDKSSFNEMFKEKQKRLVEERAALRDAARTGIEYRPIECHEYRDIENGRIHVIRNDTGEIVTSRPMTMDERQLSIADITPENRRGRVRKAVAKAVAEATEEVNQALAEMNAAAARVTDKDEPGAAG